MKTPFVAAVRAIVSKDLRAEWRSRELVSAMALFSLLTVLVFSFALELDKSAREAVISGVLWVSLIFASLLGFNRSLSLEHDQGSLDALLLAPVSRSALFVGKLLGNFTFTMLVALMLLPLMTALYGVNLLDGWALLTTVVGVFGFSAIGTLLATLAVQTRSREALLPIALLPVCLPFLLTAVRATKGILGGAPQSEWQVWLQLLATITSIYMVLCLLLYRFVLEE
ncbi:MAG: heme exporter protein CcmB [Chloroflexi bacterium]|nr:heme exporter protein CcmB [Chloroflexota bacterium]MCY3581195.1 heme exporter protein CcmB [Chloroflexota bacterium]MCY3716793.1 heme exporter protein CcmB [Chloroflexota bacterium]MDE2649160.1 heme exporter protein CcmB [Chloroflexota bacterium]MXV92417.1 ABC transporter permease subunit [Chloroflexota bacterium]